MSDAKINIHTIAREAKVSSTTVSKFINGTETIPISQTNRRKISRIMRELNYRPHVGGSMTPRGERKIKKLGFVYGEHVIRSVFDLMRLPNLDQLFSVLSSALEQEEWKLEVLSIRDEDSRRDWNEALVDADFVVNYGQLHALMADTLHRRNVPWLQISPVKEYRMRGDWHDEPVEFDHFYWHSERPIEEIFEKFHAEGARNFVYLSTWNVSTRRSPIWALDADRKIQAFNDALARHPDSVGTVLSPPLPDNLEIPYEFEVARMEVDAHAKRLAEADALVCHNDLLARGALSRMLEIPFLRDLPLRVSGEGNYSAFQYWKPRILTSAVDYACLGRSIVDVIAEHRNGPPDRPPIQKEIPTILY